MEFKLLRTFVTVAHTNSFSETAQILSYAQSSISEQIKKLEQSLGTVLFDRLGNNISLTRDGEKLLHYAEKILNLCDEAVGSLSTTSPEEVKGEVRIAITETLCFYRLPMLLERFNMLYPNVDIKIKMGNCYDFPIWIRKNLIDVAYVLDNTKDYEDIISEVLFDEPLYLVVSKQHRLAGYSLVIPEEIRNEKLILTQKGSQYREIFESTVLKSIDLKHTPSEFESIEAIKHFVSSNLGIAFLPYSVVEDEVAKGELSILNINKSKLSISAKMLYHNKKWLAPAMNALIKLTRELI